MMTYLLLLASVLLGALVVLILKPSKKTVRLLLAFSGAYLLSVAILHLLPEVYNGSSDNNIMGICILAGVILQSVLESFSKGAEHGHINIHTNGRTFPRLLFVSLCVHAFSEGLPIYHSGDNLLWAIIVHKIPIAIILTIFLVNSNFSKNINLSESKTPKGLIKANTDKKTPIVFLEKLLFTRNIVKIMAIGIL